MNRLTYKLDEPIKTKYLNYEYKRISDYDIDRCNFGRITDDMIFNKLGQLEDLEEELEIDLVTLFKALQNGVWYKDYKDNDKIKFTDDIEENMKCKELIVPAKYTIIGLKFRVYGKTFALTREELENE